MASAKRRSRCVVLILALIGVLVSGCGMPCLWAGCETDSGDRSAFISGVRTLGEASPTTVVLHVRMNFDAADMHVSTQGIVAVLVDPKIPHPVDFSVVRDADTAELTLTSYDRGVDEYAMAFIPFEQCGPESCAGRFTITIRPRVPELGYVMWEVGVKTMFSGQPPFHGAYPTVDLESQS